MNDRMGLSLVHKKSISIAAGPYVSFQNQANRSQLTCAAFGRVRDASQIKWIYPLGAPIKHTKKSVIGNKNFVLK